MDSYLKILMLDNGLSLNETMFKLMDRAVLNNVLERDTDPKSTEQWFRAKVP